MSLLFLGFLFVICLVLPSLFTHLEGLENESKNVQTAQSIAPAYSTEIMDSASKYTEEKDLGLLDLSSNPIQ